ncbi:MAG TPA: VOC family protein [Solirubrobacteraceae bacterium]|nr:VOC family protein [Solirubrobacteraceae bacterium]
MTATTTIDEIVLADRPDPWAACGFAVSEDACEVGTVRLRFAGAAGGGQGDARGPGGAQDAGSRPPARPGDRTPAGILSWSLRGIAGGALSPEGEGLVHGLPTTLSHSALREPAPEHPNGVLAIDHVVAMTPDLDRDVAALTAAGLDLRRVREQPTPAGAPRQAFFRLGPTILELVQEPDAASSRGEALARAGGRDAAGAGERPARFWGLAFVVRDIERTAAQLAPHVGDVRPAVQAGRLIATVRRSAGLCVPVALMSEQTPGAGGVDESPAAVERAGGEGAAA